VTKIIYKKQVTDSFQRHRLQHPHPHVRGISIFFWNSIFTANVPPSPKSSKPDFGEGSLFLDCNNLDKQQVSGFPFSRIARTAILEKGTGGNEDVPDHLKQNCQVANTRIRVRVFQAYFARTLENTPIGAGARASD
jgi:hypothetical protein